MAYEHPVHFGRGSMQAGSDLLVDPNTDFTKLPLSEMLNLHVHWGTPQAGANDIRYDNEDGHQNSYVYDIIEVVNPHTLRLHLPAKVDDQVSYSIGRRSYGKFRVSNCEFFLLDTRGDRDMHDVRQRDKPVNNVFNMPQKLGDQRWIAYPHPQIVFQYFDGRTGELAYAEAISLERQ